MHRVYRNKEMGKMKKRNILDLSDGPYDRKIEDVILVDLLMDKEQEESIFLSFQKFSHTC